MIGQIALWLAKELLKLAAGKALRLALPAIMTRLDEFLPFNLASSGPAWINTLIRSAAKNALGRYPTPIEESVIRLIWDPVKCAEMRSGKRS